MDPKKALITAAAVAGVTLAAVVSFDVAQAANKTATLVPPTGWTDIESAGFKYNPCATGSGAGCVARVQAVIRACATDAAKGIQECRTVSINLDPAANNVSTLGSQLATAWNNASGY